MFLKSWLWKNSPESWHGSTDCSVLRRFAYISSLVHAQPLVGMCCCTHFTDEKIRSQGGEVTHSRSNSQVVTELGFKPTSFCLHYPGPYPPGSPHFCGPWSGGGQERRWAAQEALGSSGARLLPTLSRGPLCLQKPVPLCHSHGYANPRAPLHEGPSW